MATSITVRAVPGEVPPPILRRGAAAALEFFDTVEQSCSRFLSTSALTRVNAAPDEWHLVPPALAAMLAEAWWAHRITDGTFDPRVLSALVALGYARRLPTSDVTTSVAPAPIVAGEWRPGFCPQSGAVNLGGAPVDLGGIGKGLTVRWASMRMREVTRTFLVAAGGDCYCAGAGPDDGRGWRVAVEDPRGGTDPLAIVRCSDQAVATSSIRVRHWKANGAAVHHLIDPRTGRPGGAGLLAVTVIARDPALAEVWSKALFLRGRTGIAPAAEERAIAALWVDEDGRLCRSDAGAPYVLWEAA